MNTFSTNHPWKINSNERRKNITTHEYMENNRLGVVNIFFGLQKDGKLWHVIFYALVCSEFLV